MKKELSPERHVWYNKSMKGSIDLPQFNKITYGRGYAYSLQYHILWCTRDCRRVFTGQLAPECEGIMRRMAQEYQFDILLMDVEPDHIHLFLNCKPQFKISDMIKVFKGNIARWLFMDHPELKKDLPGGHMWMTSYFSAVESEQAEDQMMEYLDKMRKKAAR